MHIYRGVEGPWHVSGELRRLLGFFWLHAAAFSRLALLYQFTLGFARLLGLAILQRMRARSRWIRRFAAQLSSEKLWL